MKWRGHRQKHSAFGAFRFGDFDSPFDGGFVAGDNHLAGAIIVGRLTNLTLRRFRRDSCGCVEFETDKRRHGSRTNRDGFLHCLPARAQ